MCRQCAAGEGISETLYYQEINKIGDHPYKKSSKRNNSKLGFQTETKVVNDFARKTRRSGAVNGEGDIVILPNDLSIQVEVKYRSSQGFRVSKEEWLTARRKGINCFVIVSNMDKAIFMSEELFLSLVELASAKVNYQGDVNGQHD